MTADFKFPDKEEHAMTASSSLPRRFVKLQVLCQESQTTEETTSFDPRLLSLNDLERIVKAVDGLRFEILVEFARRRGINKKPTTEYYPPRPSLEPPNVRSLRGKTLADFAHVDLDLDLGL